MNGWWWVALAIAVQIAGAVVMSRALRHGEQQARHARTTRHTAPHAPAWARTHHRTHRRTRR